MFLDLQYFSVGILHCFPVNLTVIFYSVVLASDGKLVIGETVFGTRKMFK